MRNAMKDKIHSGQAAIGVSLMFPSPQLVEMCAYAGFDWVLIDCEHGSIGLADVEVMAMAADASGITAIAGFGVLMLSSIPMLRDFGLVTVIDLAVSLGGVLVVLPAALRAAEGGALVGRAGELARRLGSRGQRLRRRPSVV